MPAMPHDQAPARAVSKPGGPPLGSAGPVPGSVPIMRTPLSRLAWPLPQESAAKLRTSPCEVSGLVSAGTGAGGTTARARNDREPLDPRLSHQNRPAPSARHAGLAGVSAFAFDLPHHHRLRHRPFARTSGARTSLRQSAPQRGAPHSSPRRSPSLQRPALRVLSGNSASRKPVALGMPLVAASGFDVMRQTSVVNRTSVPGQDAKICTPPRLTNDERRLPVL